MTAITAHTSEMWSAEGIANYLLISALFRAKCLLWEAAVATVRRSSNNPVSHLISTRNSTKFSRHGDLATEICVSLQTIWGTLWRSWLTRCATSRKVAGSIIPDGVTGISQWYIPSGRTAALGLTQFLREASTRNISRGGGGVKAAGASGRQPYRLHVLIVFTSVSLALLESWGSVQARTAVALPFTCEQYRVMYNSFTLRRSTHEQYVTNLIVTAAMTATLR